MVDIVFDDSKNNVFMYTCTATCDEVGAHKQGISCSNVCTVYSCVNYRLKRLLPS